MVVRDEMSTRKRELEINVKGKEAYVAIMIKRLHDQEMSGKKLKSKFVEGTSDWPPFFLRPV